MKLWTTKSCGVYKSLKVDTIIPFNGALYSFFDFYRGVEAQLFLGLGDVVGHVLRRTLNSESCYHGRAPPEDPVLHLR